MADFSVTQSLFGLNPQAIEDQRRALLARQEDEAGLRLAQLDSNQRDVYNAYSIARRGMRGAGELAAGLLGVDTAPRQVKLAQATQAILRDLQASGMDPNDTIGVRKELARRLGAAGFSQEAAMLAQEAGAEDLDNRKTAAEITYKQAAALKSVSDVKNAKTPFQELVQTGKFTPESLALFEKTGSVSDLSLADDKYEKVETDDGVWMVNKKDPKDRMRLGDNKTNESTDRWMMNKWQGYLAKATDPKTGKLDWSRLTESERGEAKAVAASARMFGKEGAQSFFMDLAQNLGQEESKTLSSVIRAEAFNREFAAITKEWVPKADAKSTATFYAALQNAGSTGVTPAVALNIIKDKEAARYISSAIRVVNAILRRESGAAVTESEWQRYGAGFVPMPGDTPEAVAEKERARNVWLSSEKDAFSNAQKNAYAQNKTQFIDMTPGAKAPDKTNPLVAAAYAAQRAGNYNEWFKGLAAEEKAALRKALNGGK